MSMTQTADTGTDRDPGPVVGVPAWTIAAIRRESRNVPTAKLCEQADDLAHIPRLLRSLTWGWLGAIAIELGERALTAEATPGKAASGPRR